jgi:glycosyltransferase involved in cell wall biosynthesis
MLNPPLVSIIVVLYNAEKTLGRTLDSILQQDYQALEVLLIDDGSTDDSAALCEEYARKDSRFRVFHQENGGVSIARQKALDAARGTYLTHIDADDWVEPDMIGKMVEAIDAEEADILLADYYEVFDNMTRRCRQNPGADRTAPVLLRRLLNFDLMGFCCTKLYRTELCRKVRYVPDNLRFREDELFNARLMLYSPRVTYLPEAFYYYDKTGSPLSLSRAPKEKIYDTEKFLVAEYEKLVWFCNVGPDAPDPLFRRKKEVLYDGIFLGKYVDLKLYPEIHPVIKKNAFRDYWDFCLSVGLSHLPRLGHLLFRAGRALFELRERIRNR